MKRDDQTATTPTPEGYEAPQVEAVTTTEDLEREAHYAGLTG